jgi:hypothetical protein
MRTFLLSILFFVSLNYITCFTLSELLLIGGVGSNLCLRDGHFLCNYGNGTSACVDFAEGDQGCFSTLGFVDCETCASYNLTTCRLYNQTIGEVIFFNTTTKIEICSMFQNCSEGFTSPPPNVTIDVPISCHNCCVGHSREYWRANNIYASYPNNISWPISEATIMCNISGILTNYYYYLNLTLEGGNALTQLGNEIVIALLNIELAGNCVNQTQIDYVNTAKNFLLNHCRPLRLTADVIASANTYKENIKVMNTYLLCED